MCGIGPDHAAHKLPAEHYALPLCCSSRGLPCAEHAGLRCNIFPSANVFASNQSDKCSGKKVFYQACEKNHRLNFEKEWKKLQDLRKLSFHSLMSDGTSPLFVPSFPFLICLYCSPCHSCISCLPCPSCLGFLSSVVYFKTSKCFWHLPHKPRPLVLLFVSPADETKYRTYTR